MKLQHQEEWSIGNLKRRVNQADPKQDLTTNPEKVCIIFRKFTFHAIWTLKSARSHCEGLLVNYFKFSE